MNVSRSGLSTGTPGKITKLLKSTISAMDGEDVRGAYVSMHIGSAISVLRRKRRIIDFVVGDKRISRSGLVIVAPCGACRARHSCTRACSTHARKCLYGICVVNRPARTPPNDGLSAICQRRNVYRTYTQMHDTILEYSNRSYFLMCVLISKQNKNVFRTLSL
jgi:hypothetical protein